MRGVIVKKKSPLNKVYLLPPIVKIALGVLLLLFVCGVGYVLLNQRALRQLSISNSQRKSAEKKIKKNIENYAELALLSKKTKEETKYYHKLLGQLPPRSRVDELLADISKIGTGEGLKFVFFKPQEPKNQEYFETMPVKVAVIGKYHQIAQFLSHIANLPHSVVAVNQFTLSHTSADAKGQVKSELLTFHFTATLYYAVASPKALPQ